MNVHELARYLPTRPKPETIRNWVNKGKIPFHKSGDAKNSKLVFLKDEIDLWLKNGMSLGETVYAEIINNTGKTVVITCDGATVAIIPFKKKRKAEGYLTFSDGFKFQMVSHEK